MSDRIGAYFDGPPQPQPQPEPVGVLLGEMPVGGVTVTGLTRIWEPGDTERCRLCPTCMADHERGVCTILVAVPVPREGVGLFDARRLRWE